MFAGGFTLEAAQHVASDERIDPWTVLDHLGALVDKSLVLAEGDPMPRYRLLETTRAYALERLAEAGETQATLRRHAEAVLALLEPFETDDWQWRATGSTVPAARRRARQPARRARLGGNGRRRQRAGRGAGRRLVLRVVVVGPLGGRSCALPRLAPARRRLRCTRSRGTVLADAIGNLGLYSFRREGYDAAMRAAALYREQGDDRRCFDALLSAAVQGTRFATVAEMEAAIAEAARLERPEWPARERASLQFARCWWLARHGRIEEALACARLQVDVCRDGGVEIASLYSISNVTIMEVALGRWEDALEHAHTAIARLHALGSDAGAGHLYQTEMIALMMRGRLDEARAAARNAYTRLLHEGDEYRMLLSLALLDALQGRLDVAARIVGFDAAIQARIGETVDVMAPNIRARLDPLLATGLPADERARLVAEGAALRDDEAFRLAFGDSA